MATIRVFQPTDQDKARTLILAGLVEHWGWLDPDKNPDLDNIAASYAHGVFLTAWEGKNLLGTGALIPEGEGTGRIVRMSVLKTARRKGIGAAILYKLITSGRLSGFNAIVVETTSTWQDAIDFYLKYGFCITGEHEGETHFKFEL